MKPACKSCTKEHELRSNRRSQPMKRVPYDLKKTNYVHMKHTCLVNAIEDENI
jgi:hypothetical protein